MEIVERGLLLLRKSCEVVSTSPIPYHLAKLSTTTRNSQEQLKECD